MLIVEPHIVTDETYKYSNIPESEHDEWILGTFYKRGTYVMVESVHAIYQCLRDHTATITTSPIAEAEAVANPLAATPEILHWVYVSATNRWRFFDGRPTQKSERANQIIASVQFESRICSVGIIGLEDCSAATIGLIGRDGGEVTLRWTQPSQTGDSSITGYQYRHRTGSGSPWSNWEDMNMTNVRIAGSMREYVVDGLSPDRPYQFQIRAINQNLNLANPSNAADMEITSEEVG